MTDQTTLDAPAGGEPAPAKGKGKGAAKPPAGKPTEPREYVVIREPDGNSVQVVGRFKGTTPKHARIEAAKSGEFDRDELEGGVKLRAIPASSFDADADAKPVKLAVREEYDA
jgi:hypothetical protein